MSPSPERMSGRAVSGEMGRARRSRFTFLPGLRPGFLAVFAGVFLAALPASAEQFVNASSKFCLDTDGAAQNGGQVRMWECASHPNQIWSVKQSGGNSVQFENAASKFCLDTDGAKVNGGQVRMWQCANHPNQIWEMVSIGDNRYRIVNKASGYCLDTDGNAVNAGQARMWQCANHPNQTWSIRSAVRPLARGPGAGPLTARPPAPPSGPATRDTGPGRLTARPSGAPLAPLAKGKDPGPLGRGQAEGSLNGKSFASFPACNLNAPKPVLEVLDLLQQIAGNFGASVTKDFRCGRYKREIATGVTLHKPVHAPTAQPRWNHLGGRGKLMAESMLCLMKDIGDLPGGRFTRTAPVPVGIGKVELQQTVGLSKFDAAARQAILYQVVRICAPLLGCLDAQRQDITATVRESAPAFPSGYKLLDYPIKDSYSLEVATNWSYTNLGAKLPPFTIVTPYGQVEVRPGFSYMSSLYPVDTPFNFKGGTRHAFHFPKIFGNSVRNVLLDDSYGRSGTPFILNVIANLPQAKAPRPDNLPPDAIWAPQDTDPLKPQGWVSQLGLGARDGAWDAQEWKPAAGEKYPARGDYNMTQARNGLERAPTANFVAEAPIRFQPPNPLSFLKLPAGLLDGKPEFWIDINPRFAADYAAQLSLLSREGKMSDACLVGGEFGSPCGMAETALVSQANAQGRVEIVGNIHLKIPLPWPFETIDINVPYRVPLPSPDRRWDPKPEINSVEAAHNSNKVAWAGHVAVSRPDNAFWQGARGFSGMKTSNLAQWTEQCLKTPPKNTSPPPDPVHTPGKADELTPDLLPCNICIVGQSGTLKDGTKVSFPSHYVPEEVVARKPGLAPPVCAYKQNQGCYEMCSWNKSTGKWIRVEKSAAEIGGAKCQAQPH